MGSARITARLLILVALTFASGCAGDEAPRPPSVAITDSAGIEIVHSSAPAWSPGEGWSTSEEPTLEIGTAGGDPDYALYGVGRVVRLPDGRIAVGGSSTPTVDGSGSPMSRPTWRSGTLAPITCSACIETISMSSAYGCTRFGGDGFSLHHLPPIPRVVDRVPLSDAPAGSSPAGARSVRQGLVRPRLGIGASRPSPETPHAARPHPPGVIVTWMTEDVAG